AAEAPGPVVGDVRQLEAGHLLPHPRVEDLRDGPTGVGTVAVGGRGGVGGELLVHARHPIRAGRTARRERTAGYGAAGATPRDSSRSTTRRRISSRIGRTASTPWPAGSSSSQSS